MCGGYFAATGSRTYDHNRAVTMKTLLTTALVFSCAQCFAGEPLTILIPRNPSPEVVLASKEARRYVYLRTGTLAEIVEDNAPPPGQAATIALVPIGSPLFANLRFPPSFRDSLRTMPEEAYCLRTLHLPDRTMLLIAGSTDIATLYGAYTFAEHLGIRFAAHGDYIPDGRIPLTLPDVAEWHSPLFATRGLQPFHDFPEGPDWWSVDDYKAIFSQMVKMRMNFFGLHTYPEGGIGPEPTVWIGFRDDIRANGEVASSYPARYFTTTGDPCWGYNPQRTEDYLFGCDQLFETDAYGSDVMSDYTPHPRIGRWEPYPPEELRSIEPRLLGDREWNELFRTAALSLKDAFAFGRDLGIKMCIGTETPLTVPAAVRQRALVLGKDTSELSLTRELYAGMFSRTTQTLPVDYYWFWTPEGWTWSGNTEQSVARTRQDLAAAQEAAANVGVSFSFATCGWVLGPKQNRSLFDTFLPKTWAMSCINRMVGYDPVDPDFARISGRPLWAIPWLEDDPALILPQLWVGRVRRDAADALSFGCTGLIGIHWRTRVLGPNIGALARAGWTQRPWNPAPQKRFTPQEAVERSKDPIRDLSDRDFYVDWCRSAFSGPATEKIASLFSRLDGLERYDRGKESATNLPVPADWVQGPGGVKPDTLTWDLRQNDYAFVDEFERLSPTVVGATHREQFDYWLNTFRYLRATGKFACTAGEINRLFAVARKDSSDNRTKHKPALLSLRERQMNELEDVFRHLMNTVSTRGELGTVANWQQHVLMSAVVIPGHDIERLLGESMPASCWPQQKRLSVDHVIVPTVRSVLRKGEDLRLTVILPLEGIQSARVLWKPLTGKEFMQQDLRHVNRAVWKVIVPASELRDDIEYCIEVKTAEKAHWYPAGAPERKSIVVIY